MILTALLAASAIGQVFPGRFVEETIPSAGGVLIEAAVMLPHLGPRDRATEMIVAKALFDGARGFKKEQIRGATVNVGQPLSCRANPDCLRITIGVGNDDWDTGLAILLALLTHPDLSDSSIEAAKDSLRFQKKSSWAQALDPGAPPFAGIRATEARLFMERNVRPESVSIVVVGSFNPGDPRAKWLNLTKRWTATSLSKLSPETQAIPLPRHSSTAVTTLQFQGPLVDSSTPGFSATLLAAYALGVGKGSSVFRILREKERLSYRQEATLIPDDKGFHLAILTAFLPRDDEADIPDRIRKDLLEDIANWRDEDLQRAQALASTTLSSFWASVPIAVTAEGPPTNEDRYFMEAYWPMKTGQIWRARAISDSLKDVSLDDLKAAAKSSIEGAVPLLVSGQTP